MVMSAKSAENGMKVIFLLLFWDMCKLAWPLVSSFSIQLPSWHQRTGERNLLSTLSHPFHFCPTKWPPRCPESSQVLLKASSSFSSATSNPAEDLNTSTAPDIKEDIHILFETYASDGLIDKPALESMPPFSGLLVRDSSNSFDPCRRNFWNSQGRLKIVALEFLRDFRNAGKTLFSE
jgi:hypothetical protein